MEMQKRERRRRKKKEAIDSRGERIDNNKTYAANSSSIAMRSLLPLILRVPIFMILLCRVHIEITHCVANANIEIFSAWT